MNRRVLNIVTATSAAVVCSSAFAQPFLSFDPRSMGMGGAGVAVARPATASFFNPALLSLPREGDDFALTIPYVGARVRDPDNFSDSIDSTQSAINKLDATITFVEANPTEVSNFTDLVRDFGAMNNELKRLSDKPLSGDIGLGIAGGVPGKTIGIGAYVEGHGVISGVASYSAVDQVLVDGLISDAATLDNCVNDIINCATTPPTLNTITVDDPSNPTAIQVNFDPNENLTSTADGRGVGVSEAGISLSHAFTHFALGVTPKFVRVDTFDYQANVDTADADNFDASDYSKKYSDFNLDVGIAKTFGDSAHVGLVIKNLLSQEYDTAQKERLSAALYDKRGGAIELNPQVRAGAAYELSWVTLATDLDLTKNKSFGITKDSQYFSLGAEFDPIKFLLLRVGYRADLVDSGASVLTAGLGFALFGTHFDIAVAGNDNEVGGALQFGIAF